MVAGKLANLKEGRPSKNNSANLRSIPEAAKAMNVSDFSVKASKKVLKEGGPCNFEGYGGAQWGM